MPQPPEEKQLRDFLSTLPEETVYQLLLIMYLGRGDIGVANLGESEETLKQMFPKPEGAISQMMGKAALADYLEDGLEMLRRAGIKPNTMFAKAKRQRG